MNAASSMNRLTRKARRVALAWGLVAAAGPISIAAQSGHGVPSGSLGGDPMQSNYRSDSVGPNSTGPGSIEQTQFDFLSERPSRINQQPVRRYVDPRAAAAWQSEDEGAGGIGLGARVGHNTGNTVGRDQSITNFELMPYVMAGDQMVFGSFRFFRSDTSNLGGSTGLGYRHYVEDWNKVLGISGWYDLDDHRGVAYEQGSLGFEVLGDTWDVRANWYIPFGDLTQIVSTNIVQGSQRFAGNSIFFSTITDQQTAANGVDVMFTVPVPGDWAAAHNLEASAGFYHFLDADNDASSFSGYRLRADAGFWNDLVHMYTEVNSDPQTDVGVSFGVSLDWHGGINTVRRRGGRQKNRMGEFVRRNDHIVTIDTPLITPDVQAINPTTGAAYTVAHVDRNRNEAVAFDATSAAFPLGGFPGGAGVGTFEDPFSDANGLTNGIATGNDIVFVAGGPTNTFSTPVTIGANQAFLGEASGITHLINVTQLDDPIALPTPSVDRSPIALTRPTISGAAGTAVTLTNNSRFGGFIVDGMGATTTGVNASGAMAGELRDITVLNINGVGMNMTGSAGTFLFENFQIGQLAGVTPSNGASGSAFLVDGGSPIINFLGAAAPGAPAGSLIANTAGLALEVRNMTGGNVGLSTLNIADTGGSGILVTNNAGGVTLGPAQLTNTTATAGSLASAIEITNVTGTGTVNFLNTVTITNPGDDAIVIDNLGQNGQVVGNALSQINVTQNVAAANHVGLQLNNISGQVNLLGTTRFNGSVNGVNTITDAAVNFQNSSGQVTLNNLNITTRRGPGVNVGDDDLAVESVFDSPFNAADPNETNAATSIFTVRGASTFNNVGATGGNATFIDNASFQSLNDFGTVQTQGILSIDNRPGIGILVNGMQTGSRVSFGSVEMDDSNAAIEDDPAILVAGNRGATSFGAVTIDGTDSSNTTTSFTDIVLVLDNNRAAITEPLAAAGVRFGSLSITDATLRPGFSALHVQDNDLFNVDGGTIEVSSGRAVTALNNLNSIDQGGTVASIIDFLTFDSISVDNGTGVDAAILLENNRGDFVIEGTDNTLGSGGSIDSTTVGVRIRNLDGQVEINGLEIQATTNDAISIDNLRANDQFVPNLAQTIVPVRAIGGDAGGLAALGTVQAQQTDLDDFRNVKTSVSLDDVTIDNIGNATADVGVRLLNIDEFVAEDTTIEMTAGTAIDYRVTTTTPQDMTYLFDIEDSSITGNGFTTFGALLNVDIAGTDDEDTSLTFRVSNVDFDTSGFDVGAINVDTDGAVAATIVGGANSTISAGDGFGNGQLAAINFDVGDSSNFAGIQIQSYTINQASDIGAINIDADGDIGLEITNNIFNIGEVVGNAIELDLNFPTADVEIVNNDFNMNADAQVAVDVTGMVGPSRFFFQDNDIVFTANQFVNSEIGVRFRGITGTVSLSGTNNNIPNFDQFTIFFDGNAANFGGTTVDINGTPFP